MAIDGSTVDVADTPENDETFGRPSNGSMPGPYPQVRIVGLGECGTRAVIAARFGPYRMSENELVDTLVPYCEPGMLLLADRNFFGHQRWQLFCQTGAQLLWRVQENVALPCLERFADGSYRSVLSTQNQRLRAARESAKTRQRVEPAGQSVRVIEYEITNRKDETELICLITTITDPNQAAAHELAAAYHDRWEIETTLNEIKATQRGSNRVLRSKSLNWCAKRSGRCCSPTTQSVTSAERRPTISMNPSNAWRSYEPCASCAARSPTRRLFPCPPSPRDP
jgi:hypothetical protein